MHHLGFEAGGNALIPALAVRNGRPGQNSEHRQQRQVEARRDERTIEELLGRLDVVERKFGVDLSQVTQDAAEKNPTLKFIGVDQYQDRVMPNVVGLVFEEGDRFVAVARRDGRLEAAVAYDALKQALPYRAQLMSARTAAAG